MRQTISAILACGLMAFGAASATEDHCQNPGQRQFDFWLGRWDITQHIRGADGSSVTLPATTQVKLAAGGCAVVEHWNGQVQFPWAGMTAPEHIHGFSVRYFNLEEGRWHIRWMDSRMPAFNKPFVGEFKGDTGDFFLTRTTPDGDQRSRIRFKQVDPDYVRWELAIEDQEGNWTTFWVMEMQRAKGESRIHSE